MITYNSLVLTLLLAINPSNLGNNGTWSNNFNFTYSSPLTSTCCFDGTNPAIIDSYMSVKGLLQFNDDVAGAVNIEFREWTFSYSISECEYNAVYDSYYYNVVDYFSTTFNYSYSTWFNYDGYRFDNMDFFHINYYFDVHDDDLYQNVAFYTEEQGGQLDYLSTSTGGQGYDTFVKFSNGIDLTLSTDYLYDEIVDFLNNNANGGVDYERGYRDGVDEGYGVGYADGYVNGVSTDSTVFTIFNGILNVALIPVNFFLAIFNFEILGINVASFVSALLSVCVVIIVCRVVLNGGTGGDSKE